MFVRHFESFTIRTIDAGPSAVGDDAFEAIACAAEAAMSHLRLKGHLFITVVGAEIIAAGEGDDECGFALYHSGIQHVAVCGGDAPEGFEGDRLDWLDELRLSTAHEIVHYWQELNGCLDGSESCEEEAERMSREISTSWHPRQ